MRPCRRRRAPCRTPAGWTHDRPGTPTRPAAPAPSCCAPAPAHARNLSNTGIPTETLSCRAGRPTEQDARSPRSIKLPQHQPVLLPQHRRACNLAIFQPSQEVRPKRAQCLSLSMQATPVGRTMRSCLPGRPALSCYDPVLAHAHATSVTAAWEPRMLPYATKVAAPAAPALSGKRRSLPYASGRQGRAWNDTAEKRPRHANCEMLTPTAQTHDSASIANPVVV